jgi:hypothetical protein
VSYFPIVHTCAFTHQISLTKDPASVKVLAKVLRTETIISVGSDSNGKLEAAKDRVRMMTFVIGIQYPSITRTEDPNTGNIKLEFPKKKREDILKALHKDLGAGVMQYVGRIVFHAK